MAIILIQKADNPFYPLPLDYPELTVEGQRMARVNACRQWCYPHEMPIEDRAEGFAAGVRFLDAWYLKPDHDADFDPMFYDDEPLEDPTFHSDILKQWGSSRTNITIAPRGSAKSFLVRKACMLRLLARPAYSITYATSTGDNAKVMGQALKDQFYNNQRINDDWGPECPGGYLVPKRGEATFSTLHMFLKNGAWIRCLSAESKMRGARPRRFVLDDPEYDPKASTSMQLIRDYMERLLFKLVLPMIMRKNAGADWLATFVSKRHYAWHAMETKVGPDGVTRAKDSRFSFWERMTVRAAYEDDDGTTHSCWPDMWPASIAEKESNPRWKDRVSLEEIREAIGNANYQSEYMARPGEGDDNFFPSLEEVKHGYEIKEPDEVLGQAPCMSQAKIRWFSSKTKQWEEKILKHFVRESRLFMTADTSYTATTDSDFKAVVLMALTHENDLFVLDLWSKQCQEPMLVTEIFRMADRWRCPVIWAETVKQGISLYNSLYSVISSRSQEDLTGVTHLPGVKKLNPGQTEKSAKIASLQLRFEHGKIKLPLSRHDGGWGRLRNQIDEFNPDAPDGGLQHDDEIDCLSMSQYVLRGRVGRPFKEAVDERDPLQRLLDGEVYVQGTDIPLGLCVDWQKVAIEDVQQLAALRSEGASSGQRTKV